jgi:predicted acetyltransferase
VNDHIDVRLMQPHEARASSDASRTALLMGLNTDESWQKSEVGWRDGAMGASAWDGHECVGHVGSLAFSMRLPGGASVPTAGITRVGVVPTHLRRGLMSRMMHEVLREERRTGKVLAALLASEVMIYRRFGFGLATEEQRLRIDVPRVGHVRGAATGSFRLLAPAEVLAVTGEVYSRVGVRPGAITRPDWLAARYLDDAVEGGKAHHVVAHTSADGVDDGYAHYSVKWHDHDAVDQLGQMELHALEAASPAVELALWQYLCNVSLIREITVDRGPVNPLLRLAANDSRAVKVLGQWDELFLRPLDVEACLAGRVYAPVTGRVAIGVADPMFPDNDGVWEVSAEGTRRTDGPAHIHATPNAIGSTLLGGMSWVQQQAIGTASGDHAALRLADTLFGVQPAPYCGSFF